jgi:hypothetical protein
MAVSGPNIPYAMHAGIKNQMLAIVSRLKAGRNPGDAIRRAANPHTPHRIV